MAGHVDLRHDRNEPLLRMRDDLTVIILRKISAFAAADLGTSAVKSEIRPRLDLDAPALIVRKMQMQAIKLVQRNEIDHAFHIVDAEEVS